MRGLYCQGQQVRLRRDLPDPQPRVGETTLKVRAVGICETDLQLAQGYMGFEGVLGHEFVGESESGERFTAEINNACAACPTCLAGREHHCPNRTVLGILNHDGAMADLVTVPVRNLHEIPRSISDHEAVFIEPLAAAFRIVEQVPITSETTFAVVGDGKLGLLCAWVARLAGAQVHLIGKHPEKLRLAGESISIHRLAERSEIGKRFDVVADCTGSATGLPTALELIRPCGTIVLKTTIAGTYAINLAPVVIDELTIIGSRCGPFPRAIDAIANRQVDVTPLIGAVFPFDDAESAFRAAGEKGAKKIVLSIRD